MLYAVIEVVKYVAAETRREFHEKTSKERVGFALANIAMVSRVALLPPLLNKPLDEPWKWRDTAHVAAIFASDCIDGKLARRLGGESTLGAIGDPLLDKFATNALEAMLVKRGEFTPEQAARRWARDIKSTTDRNQALLAGEKPNATRAGKFSTAARMTGDTLAMSPLANKLPRFISITHRLATKALESSGKSNRKHYAELSQS